jgi:hypothetical protein
LNIFLLNNYDYLNLIDNINVLIMKRKLGIIVFLLSMVLIACTQRLTLQKDIDCSVPPEGFCNPVQWSGLPYDSSYDVNKFFDSYYTFEKVQQINTIDNDWALSFFDKRNAALMYDESNVQ